ncbi:MAG: DUF885 domain-containing protein [Phycisphaerales bacterium]|nr:DUF885 domain-containing protein [Phycisphaerales bacterium]
MNTALSRAIVALLALMFTLARASAGVPNCPPDRDRALWGLMNELILLEFESDPVTVGALLNDDSRNGQLGEVSADAIADRLRRVRSIRDRLANLDRAGFRDVDRLDADLVSYWLDTEIRDAGFERWMMPISGQSGPQVWLPQMDARARMLTVQDRADALTRLKRVPIVVGDTMDNMRLGIDAGRVPPRVVVEPAVAQSLAQASDEIRADPGISPFFEPFASLDADDPITLEARRVILERIVPVYQELAMFLQNEYLPACRESVGASDGIDGVPGYDAAIAGHTTLPNLTSDQIHQIGLDEVKRIKAEMMEVILRTDWENRRKNFANTEAKFEAFTEYLRTDPRFYYDKPEDLLDGYRAIAKRIDGELPTLFAVLPRLPYGVRPLPEYSAEAAPAAYYYPGSSELARAGSFMANLSKLDQRPRYEMLALTLHEAVPGHHLQIALAQEIENQHPIRKRMGFSAFVEGWALYAEKLGLEMGDGEGGLFGDPYDDFGRLNFEMWRAMRLVVDTGIHSKGWTRERAVEFMRTNSALSEHNIGSEVDRYIAWPGQATAYKIGELKILELRARAEKKLGDRFDLRAFHAVVLGNGVLPLPVLEAKVDRWIASF